MHSRGADRRGAPISVPLAELGLTADRRNATDRRSNGFISHIPLFADIPYDAVESIMADCATRDVPAGSVLLKAGQRNDSIHLLVAGRLRIHLDSADSPDFIPIEEGGCFGELSIIDGRPVSAYVVAETDSRVVAIHEDLFWERLIPQPGVARNLLRVLSERMRFNDDVIIERMKDKLALEHLQRELSIAHNIQLSMLPDGAGLLPDHAGIEAYAIMEPAKDIGGDFYDAFFAAPDRLFVAIGDVSGKGVPAALFMARTITQMRMEVLRSRSASTVLEAVNRALCAGNEAGMFVTLFCGILETETGIFRFANAGHNPPLLLDSDGQCEFIKVKKGLVAGIIESAHYPPDTLMLRPGQSLLLYTDGVTEALNIRNELYSEEKLLGTLRTGNRDSPRTLVETIRASLAGFSQGAPQADDITMLALRFSGPSRAATVK